MIYLLSVTTQTGTSLVWQALLVTGVALVALGVMWSLVQSWQFFSLMAGGAGRRHGRPRRRPMRSMTLATAALQLAVQSRTLNLVARVTGCCRELSTRMPLVTPTALLVASGGGAELEGVAVSARFDTGTGMWLVTVGARRMARTNTNRHSVVTLGTAPCRHPQLVNISSMTPLALGVSRYAPDQLTFPRVARLADLASEHVVTKVMGAVTTDALQARCVTHAVVDGLLVAIAARHGNVTVCIGSV